MNSSIAFMIALCSLGAYTIPSLALEVVDGPGVGLLIGRSLGHLRSLTRNGRPRHQSRDARGIASGSDKKSPAEVGPWRGFRDSELCGSPLLTG